jgi:hypothetical protein
MLSRSRALPAGFVAPCLVHRQRQVFKRIIGGVVWHERLLCRNYHQSRQPIGRSIVARGHEGAPRALSRPVLAR